MHGRLRAARHSYVAALHSQIPQRLHRDMATEPQEVPYLPDDSAD
jgi:hypothetical protein